MKKKYAIILTAGMGTRINYIVGVIAKQFIRINTMELFLYPITGLWNVGVDFFLIVTNPIIMDKIDKVLKEHSKLLGYEYEVTFNPYPNSLNGNTMIIGLKHLIKYSKNDPVFLSVSDHIFDPDMPSELLKNTCEGDIIVLGDSQPILVDINEATKIQTNDKYMIIEIGKQLTKYNYIDTGLFLVKNPYKFVRLFNEEKPIKLSEIIAHKNILAYVQPFTKQYIWKDLDTFDDLEILLGKEMRNIIIKYEKLINSSEYTQVKIL